ncbi:hypothetical protein CPter91_2881 [Collimonas pratensis]|uniref:Uncharacterized protein n=2 Tax=Collimonas pratensis TaxID=279113 RepID=A0A127Q5B4_9BURK|nr:hypothetical protein CPter91_2881 [Collimonas pratensis]
MIFVRDPGSALSGMPYISLESVIAMEIGWQKYLLFVAVFV